MARRGLKAQASALMLGLLLSVACSPNIIAPTVTASDTPVAVYNCLERDRLVNEYVVSVPRFDTVMIRLESGEIVYLEMVGGEVLRVTHVSGPACIG